MRKFILISVIAGLAVFTAGCSGSSDSAPTTTTTAAPTPTTLPYVAPTTTTTENPAVLAAVIESKCWDLWNGLNDAESLWDAYGSISGHNADWKAQGRTLAGQYREGAASCDGYLPAATISSMKQIPGYMEEIIALY